MTATRRRSWWDRPIFKFLLVGGANTAITGAILVVLSLIMPGWIAFTIAYVLGLGFSVAMTGRWVFGAETTVRRAIIFAVAYSAIYVCGLAIVQLLEALGTPAAFNGLTVLVTAPLGFVAGKSIFRTRFNREDI